MSYHDRKKCSVCPREQDTFVCTDCECSYYCSRQCRKIDQNVHRALCKSFERFEVRSCQTVRRAIYFPVDSLKPKFVWLKMDKRYDYKQPDLDDMREKFLGDPKVSSDYVWPVGIDKDFVHMTKINPGIMLGWGSKTPSADQPLNTALLMLIGNDSHGVRGPLIAYGQTRIAYGANVGPVVTDLDTTDLTLIVNYFLGRHRENQWPINAVRIFSNGERSRSGYHFQDGILLSSDVFCNGDSGIMSQFSLLFGMPLVLVSALIYGDKHKEDSVVSGRIDQLRSLLPPDKGNRTAARLLIDIGRHEESTADGFGTIPEQYLGQNLGNVTVARKDMKPLQPEYLKAFCEWIEEDLLYRFTDTNGEIRYILANETDDENRAVKLANLKQKMWNRCSRKAFYAWCHSKGLQLNHS